MYGFDSVTMMTINFFFFCFELANNAFRIDEHALDFELFVEKNKKLFKFVVA